MAETNAGKTLTNKHLERAFGVTTMTLYLWRKGSVNKTKLPTAGTGRSVAYELAAVRNWAKANGVPVLVPFRDVLADPALQPGKVGAKPKPIPSKPKKPRPSSKPKH